MSYKKGDISENPDTGENEVWDGESWVPYTGKVLPVEQDNTDTDVPQIDPNAEVQPASTARPPQGYLETAVNQLTSGQFPGGSASASLPGLMGAAPFRAAEVATVAATEVAKKLASRFATTAALPATEESLIGGYTTISKKQVSKEATQALGGRIADLVKNYGLPATGVGAGIDYAINRVSEIFD